MFLKYFLFIIIFFTTTINACEKPTMPTEYDWNNWLQEVRKEALDIGISNESVNLYLSDIKPQKKIILRDRSPSRGLGDVYKRQEYNVEQFEFSRKGIVIGFYLNKPHNPQKLLDLSMNRHSQFTLSPDQKIFYDFMGKFNSNRFELSKQILGKIK